MANKIIPNAFKALLGNAIIFKACAQIQTLETTQEQLTKLITKNSALAPNKENLSSLALELYNIIKATENSLDNVEYPGNFKKLLQQLKEATENILNTTLITDHKMSQTLPKNAEVKNNYWVNNRQKLSSYTQPKEIPSLRHKTTKKPN